MTAAVIYSQVEDNPEIIIVPERSMVYAFNQARSVTAAVFRRPVCGMFNDLAEVLYEQHPLKEKFYSKDRRYEIFYQASALRELQQRVPYQEELALILADMDEARASTRFNPELRIVKDRGYHPLNYEFHQDIEDRIMCCYNDPTTEFIRLKDGVRQSDEGFGYFKKQAHEPVFHFNPGDIWRQAGLARGLKHRAVPTGPGDAARMLMVC